ncbi:hypothetical protein HOR75_gp56 [Shewanella phage SppYZU05]|uniref:Uncharacterized protein n=1 Tax=Shewanella phage SppYZU05 TaxID=1970795 RepID=A0A1W6JTI6_9CAUD|nr:hypothetical protein HOR75_gp56 [Shewanella phage SppYZU05]ARM70582.1 hypothetical protein SppYZU05_56 [Shewanella phage SppYZU05]
MGCPWVTFNSKKRAVLVRFVQRLGAKCTISEPYNSKRSYSYRMKNLDYARIFYNERFGCWELHLYHVRVYRATRVSWQKQLRA